MTAAAGLTIRTLLYSLLAAVPAIAAAKSPQPELVVIASSVDVDFWLPPGILVQDNPVVGHTFADQRGMPLYVFACDRGTENLSDTSIFGPSPRAICGRVAQKMKRPVTSVPACVDDCLIEHPPVLAAASAVARGDWTLLSREDGARQWAWKGQALYRYRHDDTPGYPYGADIGGVWSQATVAGSVFSPYGMAKAKPPTLPTLAIPGVQAQGTESGLVVADHRGMTVYALRVASVDRQLWQPLQAGSIARTVEDWTIVREADSTPQWAYKGAPLFTCARDSKPGERNCVSDVSSPIEIRPDGQTVTEMVHARQQ